MLDIVAACADLERRRAWVEALDRPRVVISAAGELWLPIVWTARGPLYGEVISRDQQGKYQQPFHLKDYDRQPLYRLAQNMLSDLHAPPAVYLLQFDLVSSVVDSTLEFTPNQVGKDHHKIGFDRLIPFPAEPAIASIDVQQPNLFECHWRCLTNQPIYDLIIK
ncbi:hypothetical protein [Thalassoporum mexicanum]|uniref:hypothetical protein n=1 Tax=Thalassoporum mexicanum TaxID=3457544 RepID=UPI00030E001A|nr:hypothetical protein [Pseudanabaena sp. PCC 7367]